MENYSQVTCPPADGFSCAIPPSVGDDGASDNAASASSRQSIDPTAKDEDGDQARKWNRGWWLGMFFIVAVSLIWAISSVIVQYITIHLDYNQPFAITYIGSVLFTGYIPAYTGLSYFGCIRKRSPRRAENTANNGQQDYVKLAADIADDVTVPTTMALPRSNGSQEEVDDRLLASDCMVTTLSSASSNVLSDEVERGCVISKGANEDTVVVSDSSEKPRMRSHLFMMKLSLVMAPIWFLAQWTYVTSLADTSVTSSTIISNSAAFFVFVFNVLSNTETYTMCKAVGVALAICGAVAVGLGDGREGEESIWGDTVALLSAIAYGVYCTILRRGAPSDDEVSMPLVLGYMGLGSAVLFLPLLIFFALAPGVQAFEGMSFEVLKLVVAKAILDNVLCEMLWARAVLLTTPTVATVGCSLTIPFAFITDFVLHGRMPNPLAVFGASIMIGGFAFVSGGGSGCSSPHCSLRRIKPRVQPAEEPRASH